VHGDLSDFNILMGTKGPVIIDFPQAIDTAHNRNARRLLVRDVKNLTHFMGRFAPHLKKRRYGEEMWDIYEKGSLKPTTVLTGRYNPKRKVVDEDALVREIQAAAREAAMRREEQGLSKYARKAQRAREIAAALAQEQKKKKGASSPKDDEERSKKPFRKRNRKPFRHKKRNKAPRS
ncbi:MAG: RIO1 family regulatory kinase/ATPase, partial [Myxococcota bacterium]|nr:RIO1 family regulatory kinase/ATPase [Myxococcota bacterium]